MIPGIGPYAVGTVALLGAFAGAYGYGRHDGRAIESAAQARADRAGQHAQDAAQAIIETLEREVAADEAQRQEQVRVVYRDVPAVVARPDYRNRCVDGDGGELLDRAVAAANGQRGEDRSGAAAAGNVVSGAAEGR